MTLPYLDKYNKNKEGKNFLKKLTTLSNNHPSINKLAQELGISNERVFREIYKSLRAGTKIF
jgi:biotin operon repressor